MCVHVSPNPAMRLQWAQQISPVSSVIIQHDTGVSFNRCEWRTCMKQFKCYEVCIDSLNYLTYSASSQISPCYFPRANFFNPATYELIVSFQSFPGFKLKLVWSTRYDTKSQSSTGRNPSKGSPLVTIVNRSTPFINDTLSLYQAFACFSKASV